MYIFKVNTCKLHYVEQPFDAIEGWANAEYASWLKLTWKHNLETK